MIDIATSGGNDMLTSGYGSWSMYATCTKTSTESYNDLNIMIYLLIKK